MSSNQTPSAPNRLIALILVVLTTIGVPATIIAATTQEFVKNPLLWSMIVLLYEITLIILSFFTKVWQRVESEWVERVAIKMNTRFQTFVSRYRKRYLQHLFYQHRTFDVKGLTTQGIYTLDLEQVYVELSIAPQALSQMSVDPVHTITKDLQAGRHVIWEYLTLNKIGNQNLAVIGFPGSGKTTLLKHMTLALATEKNYHRTSQIPTKLPILIFLRDIADAVKKQSDITLADIVQENITKFNGPIAPLNWFESQLSRGHCLVMLDGLDEIPDSQERKRIADWVEHQTIKYGKSQFIVTSRPFGYRSNPLSGFTLLEVSPFTNEQLHRFVHNWYLANEIRSAQRVDPGIKSLARQGAEDLLQRIHRSPALYILAVNPLLLTMIANVHRYRSSLPGRRVELYAEICEVFLGKRQQARGLIVEMTPAQKQRILQPLAYHMMTNRQREIASSEAFIAMKETLARVNPDIAVNNFLTMIENTSGLLLERENGVYGFAHLTFQEYLAAVHIQEQNLVDDLTSNIEDSWWHETIRLFSAQSDASLIITKCLMDEKPSVGKLVLAIECADEAREIQPALRTKLESILLQGIEDTDLERRKIVAEAQLALRMRRMTPLTEETYRDRSLITSAEYQLFVDEAKLRGEYHQPDHWVKDVFRQGEGPLPVLGVRSSDAISFCNWLTARDITGWAYRLPTIEESIAYNSSHDWQLVSNSRAGYWFKSDDGVVKCSIQNPEQRLLTDKELEQKCNQDRRTALALFKDLEHARALIRREAGGHALENTLTPFLTQQSALQHVDKIIYLLREDSKKFDFEQLKNTLAITHDSIRSQELASSIAQNLESATRSLGDRVRDLERKIRSLPKSEQYTDYELDEAGSSILVTRKRPSSTIQDLRQDIEVLRQDLQRHKDALSVAKGLVHELDVTTPIINLASVHPPTFVQGISLDRVHKFVIDRALEINRPVAVDLANAISIISERRQILLHYGIDMKLQSLLFLYARLCVFSLLINLLRNTTQNPHISLLFELYVTLAVIEERIQGKKSAYEGILIVKERRTPDINTREK
jgi:energy-coupling factor transporter ATP-binding protein EcfA2